MRTVKSEKGERIVMQNQINDKVESKVRINLFLLPISPPSSHSIVMFFFSVRVSSLTRHFQRVLLDVEVSCVHRRT